MAVTETGAIFNSLVFGGIDSADYGIYITGEAVYDAPTRAVEMVSVPGRNGAIAIDQGYWENIEVEYPCGTFASTQAEFATNLASFRNAILSQKGYKRLTDTYNPNEYRMATYIAGLEVSPTNIGIAGEFSLKFNAKPQRWLTSGESSQTIAASGRTITNPTLYDASPLVEVEGYGTITVNGHEIELENRTLGTVSVAKSIAASGTSTAMATVSRVLESDKYNSGDTITVEPYATSPYVILDRKESSSTWFLEETNVSGGEVYVRFDFVKIRITLPAFTFTAGTDATRSDTCSFTLRYGETNPTSTVNISVVYKRTYTASTETVEGKVYSISIGALDEHAKVGEIFSALGETFADSTISTLGHPTYIDCDLGVCYKVESGTVIDLNGYIDLGSDLPVLSSGSNTITYDNTVTSLKITPRWWQL